AMRDAVAAGAPFPLVLLDAVMPGMDGFAVAEKLRGNRAFDGATIMMLSSADQEADIDRCRSVGIHSHLTKPVVSSVLFNAIVEALDGRHRAAAAAAPAARPAPAQRHPGPEAGDILGAAATTPPVRVLLAEDNLINQKVAVGILEAVGHQVAVVKNGREAV